MANGDRQDGLKDRLLMTTKAVLGLTVATKKKRAIGGKNTLIDEALNQVEGLKVQIGLCLLLSQKTIRSPPLQR